MLINGMELKINDGIEITEEWNISRVSTSRYVSGRIKAMSREMQDDKVYVEVSLESGCSVTCREDQWAYSTQPDHSIRKEKVTLRVEKVKL
jgi:hypothetical protein